MPKRRRDPTLFPVAVVVDSNEQYPFTFTNILGDADVQYRPLRIPVQRRSLYTGDYSLDGYENDVSVERKSLSDLFQTLSRGKGNRERLEDFENELARLNAMQYAAVVVEACWPRILFDPPVHSRSNTKSVFRSIVAYKQRFRGVHWEMCHGRRMAEIMTFQILRRFYLDRVKDDKIKKPMVGDEC